MGLDVLQEDADGKNALELCTNEGLMEKSIFLTTFRSPKSNDNFGEINEFKNTKYGYLVIVISLSL